MKQLIHFFKLAWKVSPFYIIVMTGSAFISGAKLLLNIVLPKLLIDELLGTKSISMLLLFGGMIVLNNVGMTFLENTVKRYLDVKRVYVVNHMNKLMAEKIMNLEYSYLENPYYLDLKERAVFAIDNQNVIAGTIVTAASILSQAVTMFSLVVLMATLGPVLIIAIVVGIVLMLLLYRTMSKYMVMMTQEIIPINRRFGYYLELGMGKTCHKDIRLYDMEKMLTDRLVGYLGDTCDLFDKIQNRTGIAMGGMNVVNELLAAFSYGYIGIRTISDIFGPRLSIGSLTMYVSAAIQFTGSVSGIGENIVMLLQRLSFLEPYFEFMSLKEETRVEGKEKFSGEVETVEFRNVTFTYPNAEKPVLKNVSFSIHKGEKISIVGLNGAGKSTLVKLICRMYQADSGEILINGKNIYEYEYLSYMKCISAVFQDYRLFNFSIAENISCKESGADEERISHLVEEVGMKEKIDSLPDGINSRFGKEYEEDGVELSGGQGQKIAIARALYKKASMVILDEPASALDPIAEAEIYEKFNNLVEDKTAIYISHRMSSSVFCDRILIIDGGTVADYDTHENLMKKTDSLYYKLFHSQAENYKLEESA